MDDLLVQSIKKRLLPAAYFIAVYLSLKMLHFNATLTKIVDTVILAITMVMVTTLLSSIIAFVAEKQWKKKPKDASNKLALKWVTGTLKTAVWIISLILFLDNMGVEITSLLAGFGIGGIAIALAAQTVLSDVFCFFTIIFDRPYEIDDFVIVGEQMGTVEHIGLKTTRLRALDGEQLVLSNSDLTKSRIRNYKSMQQRRVLFKLGVTYDTTCDKLKEIPGLIKSIINNVQDATFDRAHFVAYGASSLDFEIAYYVLSSDYTKYLDIHQEVNLRIKEEFEKKGIEFAFSTQTVHLQSKLFL